MFRKNNSSILGLLLLIISVNYAACFPRTNSTDKKLAKRCYNCDDFNMEYAKFIIQIVRYQDGIWRFRCTGALYSSRAVLTALHCVKSDFLTTSSVDYGIIFNQPNLLCVSNEHQELKFELPLLGSSGVYAIVDHHHNKMETIGVGIVTVKPNLIQDFGLDVIKFNRIPPEDNTQCSVLSYGTFHPNTNPEGIRIGKFSIMNSELCRNFFGQPYRVICGRGTNEPHSLCAGDSGALLICANQLVGFGDARYAPCNAKGISRFIRIGHLIDKINQIGADFDFFEDFEKNNYLPKTRKPVIDLGPHTLNL